MANRSIRVGAPFRRSGGARRATEWFASADITIVTQLAAATKLLSQSLTTAELAKLPFTVVRTRGMFLVQSDQIAASEEQLIGLGFGVFSDTAVTAGVASLPDPITNESDDLWFVHQFGLASVWAGEGTEGQARGLVYHFDSKAMRKVEEGSDVAVVISNGSSVFGLEFWLKFRLLVKLH